MQMTKEQEIRANSDAIDGFEPARRAILGEALGLAPFDGWTGVMIDRAAARAGIGSATARAAFPGGPGDLLRYWSDATDAAMIRAMEAPEFADLRIRDKVGFALRARIDALRPYKEAVRRAAAALALPTHGMLGARLAWKTADALWRAMDDQSTDINYYSKRAMLAGVWTSVLARWLADDSEDEAATNAFLNARIENVMQVEKAKTRFRELGIDPAKPIEWLAKLRYPARGKKPSGETA